MLARALATLTLALFCSGLAKAAGTSPTWNEYNEAPKTEAFKVVQYLDLKEGSRLVVVDAGRAQGIVQGATFKTQRRTHTGMWIETGRLKAVDVQDTFTVASVEAQGSDLSKAFFPKFSSVMAGDVAVSPRLEIARRQVVTPTVTLSYFELFEDPKGAPQSFELKDQGLETLKEAARAFTKARLSLLMVEGYTDHNGPSQANQIESYQRALTVRRYLIDELGFDEQRVVAVGYGELEPVDGTNVAGYVASNRRIVLKAVPIQPQ